jgi:hypothetical protein
MSEADDLLARCLPHLYFKHPQQAGLREEIEAYLESRRLETEPPTEQPPAPACT